MMTNFEGEDRRQSKSRINDVSDDTHAEHHKRLDRIFDDYDSKVIRDNHSFTSWLRGMFGTMQKGFFTLAGGSILMALAAGLMKWLNDQ